MDYEKNDDATNASLTSCVRYHDITHDDMKNGEGLRVVLWLSGCEHHCKECQNPCTWDPNVGLPFTQWDEAEFWEWLAKPWTQGATFSGGDPLHPANRKKVAEMMRTIKERYPEKDIWVYTGYDLKATLDGLVFENSEGEQWTYDALKYVDVLVDGRFMCDVRKADIESGKKVLWRGSSNQRIVDVQASLKNSCIVEKEK